MVMRGGTSKGAFFVHDDLPGDPAERDALLLSLMGSPDPRQIDGIGGASPLTSKVAVVRRADRDDADIAYLFLQVSVEEALVSDRQNCGNLLAATAQFALERGLIEVDEVAVNRGEMSRDPIDADPASGDGADGEHVDRRVGDGADGDGAEGDGADGDGVDHDRSNGAVASVRVHMVNTDSVATSTFPIAASRPVYAGDTAIAGVPGTAAGVLLDFDGIAGGTCGALLPTGRAVDTIDGVEVTLIDNGMPVVVIRAADLGIVGTESPAELDADDGLRERLESIRLQAGELMGLGDVTDTTVPKLTMVSGPSAEGDISTRTFIPHRCHEAIGVLGAVSVATAALLPDSPGASMLRPGAGDDGTIVCEHPTGTFTASVDLDLRGPTPVATRAGIIRTARALMDGVVFPRPDIGGETDPETDADADADAGAGAGTETSARR